MLKSYQQVINRLSTKLSTIYRNRKLISTGNKNIFSGSIFFAKRPLGSRGGVGFCLFVIVQFFQFFHDFLHIVPNLEFFAWISQEVCGVEGWH